MVYIGRNISCDLYNKHIVRLVKDIIVSMGANLTERALQRAARSVSTVHDVCNNFDKESGVPATTSEHTTREDKTDVGKVVTSVLTNQLLHVIPGRNHSTFKKMYLNPLWNWEKQKAIEWIESKKDYMKYKTITNEAHNENSDNEDNDDI